MSGKDIKSERIAVLERELEEAYYLISHAVPEWEREMAWLHRAGHQYEDWREDDDSIIKAIKKKGLSLERWHGPRKEEG